MILLSDYLKKEYGCKLYKLSFDIGCSCPNRDGTLGSGGCTFCSVGGSGDYAEKITCAADVDAAIERAKARVKEKSRSDKYIAYFQAFTNTYGDIDRLWEIYQAFLDREDIEVLSIATRPDCLGKDVLKMLSRLQNKKRLWVELGLQTIHEDTAERFHRGYLLPVFEQAYHDLTALGIPVIVHVILGLPGESKEDMRETVRYLSKLSPALMGIKLSLLHVLSGTELAKQYEAGKADLYEFTQEEYAWFVKELIAMLPDHTVVHRMTGDGPKNKLMYPLWAADKKRMVNLIHNQIKS